MNIEHELKDIIAKNLPQAVGEELQKRLQQADADVRELASLKERLEIRNKTIAELNETVIQLRDQLSKHVDIDVREAEVSKRERNAEIEALKVQLAASQGNTQFAQNVALGLVRNVEYRNSVFGSSNKSEPIVRDGYQTGTSNTSENSNSNTTQQAQ